MINFIDNKFELYLLGISLNLHRFSSVRAY